MKKSMKQFSKSIFQLLCPIIFAESYEDFMRNVLRFPNIKNLKNTFLWILIYAIYFGYIVDCFLYRYIDTYYLPLPRSSLDPFMHEIHFLVGIVGLESLFMRSYIFYSVKCRYGKDTILWLSFFLRTKVSDHPKLFDQLKIGLALLYLGLTGMLISNLMIQLIFERCTYMDFLAIMTWLIATTLAFRYTTVEIILTYIVTFCCSIIICMT